MRGTKIEALDLIGRATGIQGYWETVRNSPWYRDVSAFHPGEIGYGLWCGFLPQFLGPLSYEHSLRSIEDHRISGRRIWTSVATDWLSILAAGSIYALMKSSGAEEAAALPTTLAVKLAFNAASILANGRFS